jgi:DNA phosphorothioation-dependent restriction protein DptG
MNSNSSKILNWNVWGLNSATRREAARLMIQQVRPMLVCLQETKLDDVNDRLAAEFLGHACSGYAALNAVNTSGGVLVEWDQDLIVGDVPVRKNF